MIKFAPPHDENFKHVAFNKHISELSKASSRYRCVGKLVWTF